MFFVYTKTNSCFVLCMGGTEFKPNQNNIFDFLTGCVIGPFELPLGDLGGFSEGSSTDLLLYDGVLAFVFGEVGIWDILALGVDGVTGILIESLFEAFCLDEGLSPPKASVASLAICLTEGAGSSTRAFSAS